MSSYNATRVNPATPVTARMFSRHPLMWADVFAPDYQVPQEHLVAGVVAGQGLSGDGGEGIAYAPTPNGLYNHVDAVSFLHTVGSESMHQIAQHFLDSIRTVDQGEFPVDICKEVYNDYRHYALVGNGKKKQERTPTVRECLTEGGTPICDLGSGNGRKPYAHWRRKDDTGAYIYRGPKTLLLDKIHFGEIKGLVSLSPSQPLSLPAGMVTNMIYKQVDFETDDLAFVPKNFLLVSVNSLNQFPPHFVDNFVRNRDGIHMVPQVLKLVAEGKAMQGSDGRITTRVATKRGQEVYVEHAHEFDYAIFPSVGSDDYYKIYVEFSPRVVACVFNEGTHEIVEFAQGAALHSAQFMDKPKRYTQQNQPFMPPYKLKYDGHTMLINVTSDFIVFETAERRITLETAAGHSSPVPVDIQCEYRATNGIELVPHTVWLAGRKLIGPVVAKFMRKTKFEIPGFNFLIPEYHDTMEGVVRDMCDTPFPADGFVASGSGFATAAKFFETIDIRPCDPVVVSVINDHNAPRNTEWLFANVGENLNRVVGCRKDVKMGDARFGDPAHAACPIREFQIRDNLHSVSLKELRARDDKQVPNTVKRVKMTLPQAKHEGNNLPSLRNLLADSQLSLLRTAGFDV